MKKLIVSLVAVATVAGSMLASVNTASAQWGPPGPPPPPYREHHRHHGNGDAIVGGLAAGVVGGLIGGALAGGSGPRYVEPAPPPPPPPRCWYEDRRVGNAYDGGWHMESVRVCR